MSNPKNDSFVQSHYSNGIDIDAARRAGQNQATQNPGYVPPQQHNESADIYNERINSQTGSNG